MPKRIFRIVSYTSQLRKCFSYFCIFSTRTYYYDEKLVSLPFLSAIP